MKLAGEVVVAEDKLTRYLLVRRPRNDKSRFLARAGYLLDNWRALEKDIRNLAKTGEAVLSGTSAFGEMFVVRGGLTGPNGVTIKVKPVWIRLAESGETRFVTLVPDEEAAL